MCIFEILYKIIAKIIVLYNTTARSYFSHSGLYIFINMRYNSFATSLLVAEGDKFVSSAGKNDLNDQF